MKKLLSLVLALAMCFTLLTACGGKDTGSTTTTPDAGTTTTTPDTTTPDAGTDSGISAEGEKFEFVVVNHDAATSMCEIYIETLFGQIAEESNGRVSFSYFPGGSLFGSTETIDAVKEGSADICWSTSAFFGSVFPISEFINLPANGVTCARMGTAVFNTMLKEIPECAAEFADWKVVAAHACTYSPFSTVGTKVETPADFQGLQIRAAGTIPSMYINALGATAIAMPTPDVYESLSKGVIDGMANDWHNIDCFNLFEPIDYCLDTPVNETSCFVLMNQGKYDALPDDLKGLFDKYIDSGYASDMAGYWWDSCNFWVADKMLENGVEVYGPSEELFAYMNSDEIKAQVHGEYIKYLNDLGIDGQAMYDKCIEIVARYADEFADPYATPFHYNDWDLASVDGYQAIWNK